MSWFVTGEEAKFRGYTPITTFTPRGTGWGALELKARYQQFNVGRCRVRGRRRFLRRSDAWQ